MNDKILNAATTGNLSEFRGLLDSGADANIRDAFGWTPLMWAASMGFHDEVRMLAKNEADMDAVDQSGTTALMKAPGEVFWMLVTPPGGRRFCERGR